MGYAVHLYTFLFLSAAAVGLFLVSLRGTKQWYLLYFGLFLGSMTVNLWLTTGVRYAPVYQDLLHYASYSAGMCFFLFYEQIFGPGWLKLNRRLWQLHLVCFALVVVLAYVTLIRLEDVYWSYSLLNITSVLYVSLATLVTASKGNTDAKIFTFGLVAMMATLVRDIATAMANRDFASSQTTRWGLLLFALCLVGILIRKFARDGSHFFQEPMTFQTDPLTLQMRANAMVMHTLKNEIQRLLYLNDRNRRYLPALPESQQNELTANLAAMDQAMHHLYDMVHAVKRTDDIALACQSQSLNALIEEAAGAFRTGLSRTGITIETDLGPAISLEIDPMHIRECILNLLANSSEAIEHGEGKIQIRIFKRRSSVIVQVTDNGKGIPREHVNDVVVPLFTTKKTGTNYGVGLYYTYFVMKQHGGSFAIPDTEVGKGTTVELQFPDRSGVRKLWR